MVRSSDFLRALERATALATLIRQRRLTPSCGGHAPTAERTVGPARMIVESLTPRPGIREHNRVESRHNSDIVEVKRLPSRPRAFHPEPLTDPDLILSHHPARATVRRLPPSVELRTLPVAGWSDSTSVTRPLRSTAITAASSLLRGSPSLSSASVLSASRLEPLVPFPLASPVRFSRSVQ